MDHTNPSHNKALVYLGPRQLSWEEWPIARPGEYEVVVEVRAVGICGSDLHGYTGESGRRIPPMVMGHEAAGEVIEIGAGVNPSWAGKRVIIQPFVACGECEFCINRRGNLCRKRKFFGASLSGAMTEHLIVPQSNLVLHPNSLPFTHGTLAEPLSVAIHAVNRVADIQDRTVLVAGGGPIGLFTMKAARLSGARAVVLTDLVPERLDLAIKMGANAAFDPRDEHYLQKITDVFGVGEVDIAFDAVGIQPTFDQTLRSIKPGGTVVAIGGWKSVELNLGPVVGREMEILGSFNFTMQEFEQAVSWLESRLIDPSLIPIQTFPMENGAEVFENLSRHTGAALKVVLTH